MLSDEQLNAGYFKFNIPDEDYPTSLNVEGVWGWTTPDEKKKYNILKRLVLSSNTFFIYINLNNNVTISI